LTLSAFAGKLIFEKVVIYCSSFANLIPVTFILGFYVTLVITRWWSQFQTLPWPDSASVWISACIHGHDERGRLMRRTVVRYLNLSFIMILRLICLPVRKRFPTLEHLVDAGILMEEEKRVRARA
jgi:bestrophin-3